MRKSKNVPKLRMGFWTQKALFFYADAHGFTAAILNSGRTEQELKDKMGQGYGTLAELTEGKGVGIYSAAFVEHALTPENEYSNIESHSGPQSRDVSPINPELGHFFINVKCDVARMLRELSAHERRDGSGYSLHSAFTCLEDIQKETIKPLSERDYKKVHACWKTINEMSQKYNFFNRYKGNYEIKKKLVEFLNCKS